MAVLGAIQSKNTDIGTHVHGSQQAPLYSPLQPHTTYFQIQVHKLRFTIDYSPFCSNFPNPLILPANQP